MYETPKRWKHTDEQLVGETMTVKFTKEKETKNKVRYSILPQNSIIMVENAAIDIRGTIYVDKDSELAKESEIILEIAQVTA